MYECQSCGHRFHAPAYHKEGCRELGYSIVGGCPICGGGYIELGRNCADCIWNTEDGCTEWECQYVSRKQIRKMLKEGRIQLKEVEG